MDAAAHVNGLNRRFGVTGVVEIVAGSGGLPMVRIGSGAAAAEISLYGAQVLRWKPTGADEVLYLSERSRFEQGDAIRGGIPICFPWFRNKADDPRAPKHGFVRTREWRLDSLRADENGTVTLVCVTGSDEGTRAWWPHQFLLAYRIVVGRKLRLELSVVNRGSSPMQFEEALHTYFHVGDVERTRVRGVDGATYLDNMDNDRAKRQEGELVIAGPTDNAYLDTESAVEAVDAALGRRLRTEKSHSASTVVWNPWREGAAGLADMNPEDWRTMVCVEASNVLGCAVTLGPGEEHTLSATLSVERE
jgi:glucose-6-phosphate 1-epimerase